MQDPNLPIKFEKPTNVWLISTNAYANPHNPFDTLETRQKDELVHTRCSINLTPSLVETIPA